MEQLELVIQGYSHEKCYIVGLSLGGVTTLCLLRNRPEIFGSRVSKVFVSSLRLSVPKFGSLIIDYCYCDSGVTNGFAF